MAEAQFYRLLMKIRFDKCHEVGKVSNPNLDLADLIDKIVIMIITYLPQRFEAITKRQAKVPFRLQIWPASRSSRKFETIDPL